MNTITKQIEEFTQTNGAESTDPDYLAWRDAKVKATLADSRKHPEKAISAADVWKMFGLES